MTQMTLFIFTESATHAGTGAGLGAVDLPIQREKTTGYPMIQGSGIKGALRSQYPGQDVEKRDADGKIIAVIDAEGRNKNVVFGPANEPDFAGAVAVGDARVLAFPVRSLKGVFAWVTSVDVLARFKRDCNLPDMPELPPRPMVQGQETQAFPSDDTIVIDPEVGRKIILEEYQYHAATPETNADLPMKWADWLAKNALLDDKEQKDVTGKIAPGVYSTHYQNEFTKRFVILPDDDFRDFTLYATQVVTRIGLDRATKTVKDGALFTQELLPADTLLYVPITTTAPRATTEALKGSSFAGKPKTEDSIDDWLREKNPQRIQIGGDETIGRGFVTLWWGPKYREQN
jgi:CRISPR-associated protein Cmr4